MVPGKVFDKYIYIYGYWGITVPPGTGLFICFDSFNSPVPMHINKNTTILKAWIQKTLQTLHSFLDSRFKIQDSEGNFLNPKPWVWMREV